MQGGRGQTPWVYRMLKGDLSGAVHHEPRVLIPDLNGINMEHLIHLNRFIFLVDETKLEDMNRAYLSYGVCVLLYLLHTDDWNTPSSPHIFKG